MAANLGYIARLNRIETVWCATPLAGVFSARELQTDLAMCGIELTPKQTRRALTALVRVNLVERVGAGYQRLNHNSVSARHIAAINVLAMSVAAENPQA